MKDAAVATVVPLLLRESVSLGLGCWTLLQDTVSIHLIGKKEPLVKCDPERDMSFWSDVFVMSLSHWYSLLILNLAFVFKMHVSLLCCGIFVFCSFLFLIFFRLQKSNLTKKKHTMGGNSIMIPDAHTDMY